MNLEKQRAGPKRVLDCQMYRESKESDSTCFASSLHCGVNFINLNLFDKHKLILVNIHRIELPSEIRFGSQFHGFPLRYIIHLLPINLQLIDWNIELFRYLLN